MKKLFLATFVFFTMTISVFASDIVFQGISDGTTKKEAVKTLKKNKIKTSDFGTAVRINKKEYEGLEVLVMALLFTSEKEPKMKGFSICFTDNNSIEEVAICVKPILDEYGIEFLEKPVKDGRDTILAVGTSEDVTVIFYYNFTGGELTYNLSVSK